MFCAVDVIVPPNSRASTRMPLLGGSPQAVSIAESGKVPALLQALNCLGFSLAKQKASSVVRFDKCIHLMEQVFWAKGAYVAGAVAGVNTVVQAKDDPTVLVIEHGSGCVRSPENIWFIRFRKFEQACTSTSKLLSTLPRQAWVSFIMR